MTSCQDLTQKPLEKKESYKPDLDKAALERRQDAETKPNPIVEKVVEYVPAAAKLLGHPAEAEQQQAPAPSGPPARPHHDVQIEEFVRDQHRSVKQDGRMEG